LVRQQTALRPWFFVRSEGSGGFMACMIRAGGGFCQLEIENDFPRVGLDGAGGKSERRGELPGLLLVGERKHKFLPPLADEADDERGPARLVRGTQAFAGLAMEIFVK
jgi:hypothetical protein